ncbi:MAG: MerC domain-containing protein [Flavobacteriales bacterium]
MLRLSFSNYTTADNSDYFGILASGLCLIHCFATPFIFIVRICSAACCAETPIWWKTIDYLFVIISLFAVRQAFKASDNKLIKSGFIISWVALLILILNESFLIFDIFKNAVFIPAFALILLHIYNINSSKCEKTCC